jgi:hypothetical protein
MTLKSKSSSKTKAKSAPKKASKKAPASTMTRGATVLHKLHGDTQRMLKLEWNADHNDFVGTPVSLQEAANIASKANPPFCKNTLNDPTKKYYCEFSVPDNEYICTLVDANDPRCR